MQWYVINSLGLYVGHCAREWSGKHKNLVQEIEDARHFPSYESAQQHLQQFQYENGEVLRAPINPRLIPPIAHYII